MHCFDELEVSLSILSILNERASCARARYTYLVLLSWNDLGFGDALACSFLTIGRILQATVICMDNSEWMRNGDYTPTRFQAQADAVNLICGAKTQVSLFTCIRAL